MAFVGVQSNTKQSWEQGLPLEGEKSYTVAEAFPQNCQECSRGTAGAELLGACLFSHAMRQGYLPAAPLTPDDDMI